MRLHQCSRDKPCYYCGADPPSSREHVPPRALFSTWHGRRITVPACDRHSTSRSHIDEVIVAQIIFSVADGWVRHGEAEPSHEIKQALRSAEAQLRNVGTSPPASRTFLRKLWISSSRPSLNRWSVNSP